MTHEFKRVRAQIGPDYCAVCNEDRRHSNHTPTLVYGSASEPKSDIVRAAAEAAGVPVVEASLAPEPLSLIDAARKALYFAEGWYSDEVEGCSYAPKVRAELDEIKAAIARAAEAGIQ